MLVVILDPVTLEGTEGTAVLLVLSVNLLVDLQLVFPSKTFACCMLHFYL